MRETVKHVTQRAADLKIVDQASQPLAGVDLSVDHLQLSTEPLADGYAKVTITSGELSASTHQAAMSKLLQNAFHNSDTADETAKVDLAAIAKNSDLPTFVVTVRRDGNWYVSPAYTALEYAWKPRAVRPPSFGSAQSASVGADTPEAAVSDALHAWQAGNWDRLMALAPPDELPIYDYRAWIDQAASDTHPDFTIDKLTTSATVNGDTATVKLTASGTTGSDTDRGKWQVGGTCPSAGFSSYSSSFGTASDSGTISGPVLERLGDHPLPLGRPQRGGSVRSRLHRIRDERGADDRPGIDRGRARRRPLVREPGLDRARRPGRDDRAPRSGQRLSAHRPRVPVAARRGDHARPAVHGCAEQGHRSRVLVRRNEGPAGDRREQRQPAVLHRGRAVHQRRHRRGVRELQPDLRRPAARAAEYRELPARAHLRSVGRREAHALGRGARAEEPALADGEQRWFPDR